MDVENTEHMTRYHMLLASLFNELGDRQLWKRHFYKMLMITGIERLSPTSLEEIIVVLQRVEQQRTNDPQPIESEYSQKILELL